MFYLLRGIFDIRGVENMRYADNIVFRFLIDGNPGVTRLFRNVFYTYRYYNNPTPPAPPVVADLPDDGFVDRQYPDEDGIYYRSDFSFALLNSLDEGLARKESLKSQAQSLVDAANAAYPTYEGDDTYDFS